MPSAGILNLKKEEDNEIQNILSKKLEVYFHKLLGLKFVEEDEEFIEFWKQSTRLSEGISLKDTTKTIWNNLKDLNSEVKNKIENISAYSSCPGYE